METYILTAKKTVSGKFEDYRIQKSDLPIPTGYEKIFGPATLDDCVRELKDAAAPNWFGLTVAQYLLIGVVTVTFMVIVVIGATRLYNLQPDKDLIRTTDDSARIFITFVIAVATVAIAFLAILTAMLLREFEKRFALAKEVLTILVGILGTIVGFYFGTAKLTPATDTDTNTNTNTQAAPSPTINPAPTAFVIRRPTGRFALIVDRADERTRAVTV